eukprot:scaffold6454_cov267-Chaetoceros_neogracile.AAC.18
MKNTHQQEQLRTSASSALFEKPSSIIATDMTWMDTYHRKLPSSQMMQSEDDSFVRTNISHFFLTK